MDLHPAMIIPVLVVIFFCVFIIALIYQLCRNGCGKSRVDNGGFGEGRSNKNTRVGKVFYTPRPNMNQNTHHWSHRSKSRNHYDDDDCHVYNPTTMGMTNVHTSIPMYQDDYNSTYNYGHHGSNGHHYGGHHDSGGHHSSHHDSGGHHSSHHDTSSSYDCGGGGGGFNSGGGGGCDSGGGWGGCDSGGGGGGCDSGGGGGGCDGGGGGGCD